MIGLIPEDSLTHAKYKSVLPLTFSGMIIQIQDSCEPPVSMNQNQIKGNGIQLFISILTTIFTLIKKKKIQKTKIE